MEEYRHGTHSVFRLHVHLVWCTKYRKGVLAGDIGHRMRDLVRVAARFAPTMAVGLSPGMRTAGSRWV